MNDMQEYTLRWRGRETGPFPLSEINRQLDNHEIGMAHEILEQGRWITLEEFFPLLEGMAADETPAPARLAVPAAPPSVPVSIDNPQEPKRPRRRMLFGLLAVLAGFTGIHNFYGRQWLTGLLQLLLSIATCLMGFGIIAAWIWAMMEAILVHKDGDGMEMI